jgi:predicted nucleotidyltransferase
MIDIEKIQQEIVECLKPLKPDKVILFGSYAHGTAGEDSDIDLFLVKDTRTDSPGSYEIKARKQLRELIYKYQIGFDVLCASQAFLESREDYFYKMDILKNGKVIYAQ